jgi:Family of unknown function (DUF6062)
MGLTPIAIATRVRPLKRSKELEKQSGAGKGLWFTRSTFAGAFALGGCAICNAVHAAERKGIHSFLHEGMMFPSVRKKFLDGGGFCLHHFWMAKAIEEVAWQTGGFGIAILCNDLAQLAGSGLANANGSEPNPRSSPLRRREKPPFVPGHDCMFCRDNGEKELFLAEVLEELVDEEEFHKPLVKHGLCIRHGELSLQTGKDSRKRDELFSQLQAQLSDLVADLREFMRKRDYQYRNELPGREQDSVLRAMQFFVGPNPCGSRTRKEAS